MTDHSSPPQLGSLPLWGDIEQKIDSQGRQSLTAIESFIFNHEPADAFEPDDWRQQVHAALQEAFANGLRHAAGVATDVLIEVGGGDGNRLGLQIIGGDGRTLQDRILAAGGQP